MSPSRLAVRLAVLATVVAGVVRAEFGADSKVLKPMEVGDIVTAVESRLNDRGHQRIRCVPRCACALCHSTGVEWPCGSDLGWQSQSGEVVQASVCLHGAVSA